MLKCANTRIRTQFCYFVTFDFVTLSILQYSKAAQQQ